MSSNYPILDDKPINQWRVTELKDELKRRKLTTKGLKEDLIKRLDEALRLEREDADYSAKDEVNGLDGDIAELNNSRMGTAVGGVVDVIVKKNAETAEKGNSAIVGPIETENAQKILEFVCDESKKSCDAVPLDINSGVLRAVDQEVEYRDSPAGADSTNEREGVREAADESEKDDVNVLDGDITELNNSRMDTAVGEIVDTFVRKSAETVETAEKGNAASVEPIETENAGTVPEVTYDVSKESDDVVPVDIDSGAVQAVDQEVQYMDFPAGADSTNGREKLTSRISTTKTTITVTESVLTEVVVSRQDSISAEPQSIHDHDSATMQENDESKVRMDEDSKSKPQLDYDLKPMCEDLTPDSSLPENQVSEVNPSLGSQVKSDSISSNFVSINQKNELKNTIIADNVKLEEDIVRPGMVEEPSPRNDITGHDESHSMDVDELHKNKAPVEENRNNNKSPNLNKTNSSEDVEYPEKLNLDRSSGDDSMEEDFPESKQHDSNFNIDELRDKGESIEVSIVKEEGSTAVVGDGVYPEKGDTHHDKDLPPVSLVEKRKFHDQASVGNNEPAKRQRRWNSETVKGSDQQFPSLKPVTTPKDKPIALKRNFSKSDSSAIDDAPKERIVPPSQRPPTNSLRIDRFLRPFTLKAVQELLGKTGNVISFWMDQIKTHCYVTYSSVEEAIETRNAVYNLQWPRNGGRLLVAEHVDPQEVKLKLEAPPALVTPINNGLTAHPAHPTSQPEPPALQHREEPSFPATLLPPPPPLSKLPPAVKESLPPPPPQEKVDRPVVTLDDLFRKTSAPPRIYYLPLSEEQVAAKLAAQGKSIKQT